jgi:hypothetical protein
MKLSRALPLIPFALLMSGAVSSAMSGANVSASEALNVLFIGNSLTYTNDLPAMIAELAKAGGQAPFNHESETPGGCTFKKHWEDGKALKKIGEKPWDFVVLQEYSDMAVSAPAEMGKYGRLLNDAVVAHGSRTLWYMTWAHVDHPEQQPAITRAYADICAGTRGILVPAAVAWEHFRAAHPAVKMYVDNKHPEPIGTYLVACVFYGVIYHASPVGLPGAPAKLDADMARVCQETAWAAVQEQGAGSATAAQAAGAAR